MREATSGARGTCDLPSLINVSLSFVEQELLLGDALDAVVDARVPANPSGTGGTDGDGAVFNRCHRALGDNADGDAARTAAARAAIAAETATAAGAAIRMSIAKTAPFPLPLLPGVASAATTCAVRDELGVDEGNGSAQEEQRDARAAASALGAASTSATPAAAAAASAGRGTRAAGRGTRAATSPLTGKTGAARLAVAGLPSRFGQQTIAGGAWPRQGHRGVRTVSATTVGNAAPRDAGLPTWAVVVGSPGTATRGVDGSTDAALSRAARGAFHYHLGSRFGCRRWVTIELGLVRKLNIDGVTVHARRTVARDEGDLAHSHVLRVLDEGCHAAVSR